jgi:antitoxin CptB
MIKAHAKMQAETTMTNVEIRRLSWRCRRGLLELDIVLRRFHESYLSSLNAEELAVFDSLLDYPDNELLDVITARSVIQNTAAHPAASMQQVLAKLRHTSNE